LGASFAARTSSARPGVLANVDADKSFLMLISRADEPYLAIAGITYGSPLIDPLALIPGAHADAGDRSGGVERGEYGDD
jgi:arylamine N-acetyltransferase